MMGRVPWRSHRFQSPSLALHRLPLRKNGIGRVIAVKRGVGSRTVIIKDKRSAAQYGSAGRLLQWTTCRTVIALRVSTVDSLQGAAGADARERFKVPRMTRPRMYPPQFFLTPHQGLRPDVGESGGFGGHDSYTNHER